MFHSAAVAGPHFILTPGPNEPVDGIPEGLGTRASECVTWLRTWTQNPPLGANPCSADLAQGEATRNDKPHLEEIWCDIPRTSP